MQDGPGIRTTVFLKGCPLTCTWCHNPEGISSQPELIVIESRCLACGACRSACPFAASIAGSGPLPPRNESCTLCGECVEACPTGARQMVGRELTVAQVMREVLQDRVFYEESGGGVTFSGGEPLLQPGFLEALLSACRAQSIHTAVDTCGSARREHLLAMAPLTDLFLYDLKLMDEETHRRHTGASNRPILANLRSLGQRHRNIWLRVPVIPGINDNAENWASVAQFAASVPGIRQVNLLPYHRSGQQKHERLGRHYSLEETLPPTPESLELAVGIFRARGVNVKIGG